MQPMCHTAVETHKASEVVIVWVCIPLLHKPVFPPPGGSMKWYQVPSKLVWFCENRTSWLTLRMKTFRWNGSRSRGRMAAFTTATP